MEDFSTFATASNPIRCSAIPRLIQCPWSVAMTHLSEFEDTSGPAADTGSAVHRAAEAWHTKGMTVKQAIKEMEDSLPDYPLADLPDAETQFLAYAIDPRNAKAQIVVCESEISFTIAPAFHDETAQPIFVKGRLDQVRRDADGVLRLYDIKTSKWPGMTIRNQHMYQIAGYCVGASEKLGEDVHPGAVILTRRYLTRGVDPSSEPSGVFFRYTQTLDDARFLMQLVAMKVADIRRGRIGLNPGDYCNWCPGRSPDFCIEDLRRVKLL